MIARIAPIAFFAGLASLALPAAAQQMERVHPHQYDANRCTIQQVHTPAGKSVQSAPIVRCQPETTQIAQQDVQPADPAHPAIARD